MHQRPQVGPMRRAETFPTENVHDLTVAECDRRIEDAVERIVACRCDCPTQLLEIHRWKQKRLDLQIPRQGV